MAGLANVPQRAYLDLSGATAWDTSPVDGRGTNFLHGVCPHLLRLTAYPGAYAPGGRDVLVGRHMVSSLETHTGHSTIDRPVADDAGMVSAPAPSPCWVSRPPDTLMMGATPCTRSYSPWFSSSPRQPSPLSCCSKTARSSMSMPKNSAQYISSSTMTGSWRCSHSPPLPL